MTVSTSGILPGIRRLGRDRCGLSWRSLNGSMTRSASDHADQSQMEHRHPTGSGQKFPLRPRERITFEYVLLGGINDGLQHADELVALARRAPMPVKVNLIAWNPGPGIAYTMLALRNR